MLVYNNKINKNTKWSGDESTLGFPVSGDRVEEFIKESLQKKAGYIYLEGNNLLVFADEMDYETYSLDHSKRDLIIQWISIYNHIAYANKDSLGNIIDFSTSVSEGKDYFGICINSSENNPENPSEYNWVYIKGTPGKDGKDGIDGLNGRDGTNGINGQDGITPTIDPSTKHWMVGEVDTEVLAIGRTPYINSSTKHWIVGEEDTGILAEGTKGERGLNAPYLVTTYGKSSYSLTNSSTGPSDIVTWTQDIPQRTVGTFIWMRVQNYSGEGLLQNTQYTCITGDTGLKGKWYEYAGVWSIDDIQSVTNSTSIGYYVKYGNKFYMNIASDGEINNTVPGPNNPKWEEMPADRQFYIAKAFFGDYAEFGSGIINGDWMISKIGTNDSPSNNPHDFDPDSPNTINMNENNFIPVYALNLSNGTVYMNDANLKGTINASSGLIGGFNIQSNGIFNSIAGDAEIHPKINFELRDSGISCFSNFDVSGLKFELYNSRLHQSIITNEINSNGSGSLGQGGISWDNDGDFTITDKFVEAIFKALGQGVSNHIEDEYGLYVNESIKLNYSGLEFYKDGNDGEYVTSVLNNDGLKVNEGAYYNQDYVNYGTNVIIKSNTTSLLGGYESKLSSRELTFDYPEDEYIKTYSAVSYDKIGVYSNITESTVSGLNYLTEISNNQINLSSITKERSSYYLDDILNLYPDKIEIDSKMDDHEDPYDYKTTIESNKIKISNNITNTDTEISSTGITSDGSVTANSFIKIGGTSSQPLMADGSVKTGYTGNVNLGTHTLVIEGGIITNVTQNNS